MVVLFDHHDSIISFLAFSIGLFPFDDSDRPAVQDAAGEGGLVHQYQNINGIAVLCQGRRNETEIVRKTHARRQDLLQLKDSLSLIKGVFISTALWRLDDNSDGCL